MATELFPVEASISQINVQGRRLFTVILRDISQRRHDEQALRNSQADLNHAQSVGQIGSWRINTQSLVLLCY
ncbi:hypothetical protein [Thiobacillus denitrificans]|uniref:PAC domain-containing protein n=1 Tax=Thiobacillus denitrificans TaxID=36861 RepID=A0A106BJ74_THIDE|nr:hypothetical protein [Thiobacillus denitrificans]KVW93456.1 hypothetical protein ABW22_13980 [Thiobacillus denitrificans]